MRNKPRIRFKGFTEDWEQRKLGDLIFLNGRIGFRGYTEADIISKDEGGVLTFSPTNIVDNQITIKCKNTYITRLKYDESPEIKIYNGDILFVKTGSTLGKSALVKDIFEDATLNPQVVVMRPNNLDSEFLSVMMLTDNIASQVRKSRIGGAVPTLTESNIKAFDTLIPKNDEEAQKIGKIFGSLDHVITLHQHKLEKLKLAKKALLQKLFPKNGSQFPKIRFKGFTDAWEQRKLLTVLNKIVDYRGRTPKKLGLDWSSTGHLALSALNVKMGYIDKTVDAHYGDDHLYSVWMKDNDLYEGQVLFTTEAPMGNVAQVPDDNKYILSQRTIAFVPDRSVISDNFLAVVLSASKCQKSLTNRASGGTAKGVSQKTLSEISLDIPQSLSEQDKVSELIKKLSKVITLHQCKLDKLQDVKKGLLQKMFV